MRNKWTEEKLEWIRQNKDKCNSRQEVVDMFNKYFNTNVSFTSFINTCKRHKISLRYENVLWEDKIEWINANKHRYSDREDILNDLNKEFNTNFTLTHIKDMSTKRKLNLPLANRRINQGLKNGRIKLMGVSERRIGEDSYRSGKNIYVKTAKTSEFKKNFTLKHRYLYEKYHNEKLNDDDCIVFLDGNYNNFDKENLYKINRKIHDLMSGHKLHNTKTDKLTVIKFCEWKEKIFNLKRKGEIK